MNDGVSFQAINLHFHQPPDLRPDGGLHLIWANPVS